jgi:hypothetical protein
VGEGGVRTGYEWREGGCLIPSYRSTNVPDRPKVRLHTDIKELATGKTRGRLTVKICQAIISYFQLSFLRFSTLGAEVFFQRPNFFG